MLRKKSVQRYPIFFFADHNRELIARKSSSTYYLHHTRGEDINRTEEEGRVIVSRGEFQLRMGLTRHRHGLQLSAFSSLTRREKTPCMSFRRLASHSCCRSQSDSSSGFTLLR